MLPKRLKTSRGSESQAKNTEKNSLLHRVKDRAAETFGRIYSANRRKEEKTTTKVGAQPSSTSASASTKGIGEPPRLLEENVVWDEDTWTASTKQMLSDAFNDIPIEYTEQDVHNSLSNTRMYAAFPHLVEGNEKVEAAPLSAADTHSLIDHDEYPSARDGSAPSARASAIAGPSNRGIRYAMENRSTSSMESIQEGAGTVGSCSTRAGRSNLSVNYTYNSESDNVSMKSTRGVDTSPPAAEETPVKPRRRNFYTANNLSFRTTVEK